MSFYEMTWKIIVEPDRRHVNTTQRMRFECCVPKATNTHSEYVILISLPLQQWLHEHASVLHYTYITCIVYWKDALEVYRIFRSSVTKIHKCVLEDIWRKGTLKRRVIGQHSRDNQL
jgi:hypothetical protein